MLVGCHALPDVGDGLQVIACLDVRSNDAGDLVVTKGDQYDVREQTSDREVQTHTLIVSCRNFRRCVCY
jgi:hypothetical protein